MQEANGPVTFLNKTYDESMTLLVEARNNLAHGGVEERDQLDLAGKLTFSLEAMRLTATLTQSMAWLLVQKAVFAGEMTREDAARAPNRLGGHSVCLDGGRVSIACRPAFGVSWSGRAGSTSGSSG